MRKVLDLASNLFRPRHTAEEAARMLVSGLYDGSITLSERIILEVSNAVAEDLKKLAAELNMSTAELFVYALSVVKIAKDENGRGKRLSLTKDGRAVREFIWPPPKQKRSTS